MSHTVEDTAMVASQTTLPVAKVTLKSRLADLLIRNAMVLVILICVIYFTSNNYRFATVGNLQTILISAAPFALIAFGQTLVILSGGIDLSVGSTMALTAMLCALTAKDLHGGIALLLVVAVVAGAAVGIVNGFLVSTLRVTAFVATLATMTAVRGLAYAVGNGAPITGLPSDYGRLANATVLGLQLPVWIAIVGFFVLVFVMRKTAYGTRLYAVGGNPIASAIAGVKVNRVLFSVYLIGGALAGLAGLMLSSRVTSGAPTLASGYELNAIAAVVIGGASLLGGRGTIWGTAIGLLLIQTLNNGLDIMLVPSYFQDVIKGALIAAAVAVDVFVSRRSRE